jgi:hypothetical protein
VPAKVARILSFSLVNLLFSITGIGFRYPKLPPGLPHTPRLLPLRLSFPSLKRLGVAAML